MEESIMYFILMRPESLLATGWHKAIHDAQTWAGHSLGMFYRSSNYKDAIHFSFLYIAYQKTYLCIGS